MSLYISTDIHNDWLWGSSLRECSKRALVETLIYWLSSFSGPTEGLTLKKQTRIVKSFINSFHFSFRLSARLNLFLSLSLSLCLPLSISLALSLFLSHALSVSVCLTRPLFLFCPYTVLTYKTNSFSLSFSLPHSASLSLLALHHSHMQDERVRRHDFENLKCTERPPMKRRHSHIMTFTTFLQRPWKSK